MAHLYVYYRIAAADASAARAAVAALQTALAAHCGTAPRLARRCEDPETWMEIYENLADPGALIGAMAVRLQAPDMDVLLRSARHRECFTDA